MNASLKNKVVLITGSSIGIGRETAYMFAKNGAKLVITYYKDGKEGKETSEECRKLGAADTQLLYLDVTNNKSILKCVNEAVKKHKHIDVLINNAGVIFWKDFRKQTAPEIEAQLRTNLEGLIKMTKECLPHLESNGTIINISSGAGKYGVATLSTYCATKFGVRGFTQALAKELKNIKVYSVNPGMTATRMTNFKGVPPEHVAQVILDAAKYRKKSSGSDFDVWKSLETISYYLKRKMQK